MMDEKAMLLHKGFDCSCNRMRCPFSVGFFRCNDLKKRTSLRLEQRKRPVRDINQRSAVKIYSVPPAAYQSNSRLTSTVGWNSKQIPTF